MKPTHQPACLNRSLRATANTQKHRIQIGRLKIDSDTRHLKKIYMGSNIVPLTFFSDRTVPDDVPRATLRYRGRGWYRGMGYTR